MPIDPLLEPPVLYITILGLICLAALALQPTTWIAKQVIGHV